MASTLDIIKQINKKHKNESLVTLGNAIINCEKLAFPSPSANYPLYGGLPEGRVVQISGLESSGKTTLALTWLAQYQKTHPDRQVMWVDVEHTLDKAWAQTLGVDLERLIYMDPVGMSGEEILTDLATVFEAPDLGLVVLDSIAALSTQDEFDSKDITKVSYQSMAKPLGKFFRVIVEQLHRNRITLLCINQLRSNIGDQYHPWLEPCGKSLAFATSVLLRCGTRKFINEAGVEGSDSMEDPQGIRIKFKVVKNKVTVNNRGGGYLTIRFRSGVDVISDTLDIAVLLGMVKQGGAWYQLIDINTGEILTGNNGELLKFQGKDQLRKWFHENPKEFYKYQDMVNEALSNYDDYNGAPKLVESSDFLNEDQIVDN